MLVTLTHPTLFCMYIPRGLERVQVNPVSLDPCPLVQWEEHVPDGDGAQVHHEGLGRGLGDWQNEDWGMGCHVYSQVLVPRLGRREKERENSGEKMSKNLLPNK